MEEDNIATCDLYNTEKQEELFTFLHSCVDEICNGTGLSYCQFTNIDWTKEQFNDVHKFFLNFFCNPNCLSVDEDKMPLEYHELPENVQLAISTCLKVRRNQLTNALLFKYSSKHTPTLLDFDWRLKYIMGSSKMASIREPLLQLDFILKEKGKEEILGLELDKDELNLLINSIEAITE